MTAGRRLHQVLADGSQLRSIDIIEFGVLRKDTQGGAFQISDSVALEQESRSAAKV